ncbi:acyl-CoA-binding domain-containing protein 3-like isoform X2 [Salvia divinorum]|uniref:Acyl-CoA-binding domain-containing protein 3-like isoform X2 n=1 Tax=Salvia divinorum TaxID=28513 RepID=A0ABD1IAP0_SALDI
MEKLSYVSFLVAKIILLVTFAISNTSSGVDSVASEGIAQKGWRGKGEKRVKFVDDVVIKRVDRYEGSENLVLLIDVEEVIAEDERVVQFGGEVDSGVRESKEECFDERELDEDDAKVEGCEKIEMLLEKGVFGVDSYGENVIDLEGPCLEPQPMALMVSARTEWNARQRVGSTSRELAMEQYILVLSENIPQWMHEHQFTPTLNLTLV